MIAGRREDSLKTASARISQETGNAKILYASTDLADRRSVAAVTEHAFALMKGVDIFVGNAAQDLLVPVEQTTDDSVSQGWL